MQRRLRATALAASLAVVATMAAACGGGGEDNEAPSQGAAKQGGTFRLGIVEPTAIDPYNAQESEGILVTKQLFVGLTRINDAAETVPGVAKEWLANDDCTQWTFKLTPDTKFSNGETVTAKSFIDGMTRAAAKSSASDVAYHMAGIKGFDELQSGKGKTFSGLSAPDPNTLVVAMAAADCEFDKKTSHTVMSPVPSTAGAASNKQYNDMPIGNGPFKMAKPWEHNKSISLVRNDQYSFDKAKLDAVEVSILNPNNAQQLEYQGFQGGQFDWARIPPEQQPAAKTRYEPQGDWLAEDTNGMNYLLPIIEHGPMAKKEARLAVSYAIDRQAIIDGVFKGFQTKSTTIVPPVFKDAYQKGLCVSCEKPDPNLAKQLAQQAGLPPGSAVKLSFNTGAGHETWTQAVKAQLEDVLGWKINYSGIPFEQLLEEEQQPKATGVYRFAWGADYNTPDNFLFPLLATASINKSDAGVVQGDNRGRYSNPRFDGLLNQERAAKDAGERVRIIKEAEKVALDDMALIPLWNRSQYRLFNAQKFTGGNIDFYENPPLESISLK
jgi:ABC-type oligopeptide transport system substrate-binding subunit